jgi:hypothetical protein
MLSANLSAIFYLISGVLFILALRGLSSPETSRQGNFFGILGMIIAITVTFLSIGNFSTGFVVVLIFLIVGGLIGAFIAYKIPMTAMPELVAGFHSLVGLAAVFVAVSAFLNPGAFNLGSPGNIKLGSLIEMSIGAAVGAITKRFNINFNNCINLSTLFYPIFEFILDIISSIIFDWFFIDNSNWGSRYACSDFNVELIFWLGCSWNWIYIRKYRFNNYRCISWIIWCNFILHNVQRNE